MHKNGIRNGTCPRQWVRFLGLFLNFRVKKYLHTHRKRPIGSEMTQAFRLRLPFQPTPQKQERNAADYTWIVRASAKPNELNQASFETENGIRLIAGYRQAKDRSGI